MWPWRCMESRRIQMQARGYMTFSAPGRMLVIISFRIQFFIFIHSCLYILEWIERQEIVQCHKHCLRLFLQEYLHRTFLENRLGSFCCSWVSLYLRDLSKLCCLRHFFIDCITPSERIRNPSVLISTFQHHSWSCTCLISGISSHSSQQWWPGVWRRSGC